MIIRKIIIALFLWINLLGLKAQDKDIYLADPTIFYHHGSYFMYGTEKRPQRGFPVYVSKNLNEWNLVKNEAHGYALQAGNHAYGTQGFWAPQIFQHQDFFFMIYTANENIAIAKSNSPTGLFTQETIAPIDEKSRKIDPFVFFDDDGKAYLFHVRLKNGNSIWVAQMNADLTGIVDKTLKQCVVAIEPWENTHPEKYPPIAEGPTVIKHKGTYYLFYSANDFRNIDYAVGYATAPSPMGPWTKFSGNPIISRKITGYNGSGHGDVFFDKKSKMHYVFHIHYNDSVVSSRRTMLLDMKFVPNKKTGIDEILVDKSSVRKPQLSVK